MKYFTAILFLPILEKKVENHCFRVFLLCIGLCWDYMHHHHQFYGKLYLPNVITVALNIFSFVFEPQFIVI